MGNSERGGELIQRWQGSLMNPIPSQLGLESCGEQGSSENKMWLPSLFLKLYGLLCPRSNSPPVCPKNHKFQAP